MVAERKWFLGVDGGQSSTIALVGDETGAIRGVGNAGPCNHVSAEESRERFLHAIGGAVRAAQQAAGSEDVVFHGACLGFSGGTHDKEVLTKQIVKAHHYAITTDAHIALTGATAGEPGIIAIAGTGSIAYGRNASGKTARAGGWGYAMGDEGSAFDLVRQALRAILRFDEGWGPATSLRDALLGATSAQDANELLHRFYTPEYPRARIASFAPLVDEAAKQGDHVAREILQSAAQALATYVAAVRRQIFHRGEASTVSYIGGVFRSELLRARFQLIVELEGESRVHAPSFGPAAGALIEAYRLGGVRVLPRGSHASS
jgi:N-acetylglucosamine kinase-like BadF-type ATPase